MWSLRAMTRMRSRTSGQGVRGMLIRFGFDVGAERGETRRSSGWVGEWGGVLRSRTQEGGGREAS